MILLDKRWITIECDFFEKFFSIFIELFDSMRDTSFFG